MNRLKLWSAGACIAVIVAVGVWMMHPKGADNPLPQGLPSLISGMEPVTLVVLGSSLSSGDWPQAAAAQLTACTGRIVTVLQITGPGQGSDWARAQTARIAAAAPDIVTIEFTINDADLRRRISLSDSRDNHLAILRSLPDTAHAVLLRLNRARGRRAGLRPLQARYDAQLVDIAMQTGAGLIDLRPVWTNAPRAELPDGLHPTQTAAITRNAPALVRALAPLLTSTQDCSKR